VIGSCYDLVLRTASLLSLFVLSVLTFGQQTASTGSGPLDAGSSELRPLIERFTADRGNLERFYPHDYSPARRARMQQFYSDVLASLNQFNFAKLSLDGQADYLLLSNHVRYKVREIELENQEFAETEPLLPFLRGLSELEQGRRRLSAVDASKSATAVNEFRKQIEATRQAILSGKLTAKKTVAYRAAGLAADLRAAVKNWFEGYNAYDPMFTWWVADPWKGMDQALDAYAKTVREKLVGIKSEEKFPIVGQPAGRALLLEQLKAEMIAYTPEELIDIANKEFAWCDKEMLRASRDLGFGDDWKKALEHVKNLHVEPGKQPQMIRDLAQEAIDFVEKRDLVTVPALAKETWRMDMMTPEAQMRNPFFLGGERIQVSFPTAGMPHEAKLMSLRGNNIHFSRATVHHELIPGHHLQGFMTARHKSYRGPFRTPFWTEGWALYWEFLLWDLQFPAKAEDRVGFLFWRMHRCARIIFSLNFHLGQWTPQQCIDFLIERVGHEPDNASAEVRRSFEGTTYPPLYQAGYMLGALQFRALAKDLVGSGKMSAKQFHDRILTENRMPVEMVRALLTKQKLTKEFEASWRFYDNHGN
jgi:uncharacterized protein (DUF885 family)